MIFVSAGTKDGRELAGYLLQQGYKVTASVVSQYGESLLERYSGMHINCQALDTDGFVTYFARHGVKLFVDAGTIYFQYKGEQNGICESMRNVILSAQRMCHGVYIADV